MKKKVLSNYFYTSTGYVLLLQSDIDTFSHSAEHGKMQKQPLDTLLSSLKPKSYTLRNRLIHTSTLNYSRPTDRLTLWSSANRPSKRRCLEFVIGIGMEGRIRRESTLENAIGTEAEKQRRAPWHREGSDVPPVARQRSAGAMVKGSRMPMRASALTDVKHRKALNNPISPSQAHHTSHDP